ncbi:MAG: endo-dextranase [Chitinophagaceae bacterium]
MALISFEFPPGNKEGKISGMDSEPLLSKRTDRRLKGNGMKEKNTKNHFQMMLLMYFLFWMTGCKKPELPTTVPVHPLPGLINISTDKACYLPGEDIVFTISQSLPSTVKIRYRHLDQVVGESPLRGTTWHWTAPPTDFTGYMVDLFDSLRGSEKIYATIAVDVSSDWSHFPRYGFLSSYGKEAPVDSVIGSLNRYHINGLQFYDWEYEHHHPLAGTVTSPSPEWTDIGGRTNYLSTVQHYISAAHAHHMMAMSYNLAYGALNNAGSDGVLDSWFLYDDQPPVTKQVFNLPNPPFKSNIYLLDPSNLGWQQYIAARNKEMYQVFNFDGYHIDQLGDLNKTLYNDQGLPVDLSGTFLPFIRAMKAADPSKRLVMNAVNQYGQQGGIALAPVDFLYTEVWPPHEGYQDLARIIQDNDSYSQGTLKTVLAAYMDYDLAEHPGYFNTPGVLLTDAVIFAFGGSHIELGEHMLGKEYFPNGNLQMKPDLQQSIISYYDFLAAYENLLRDGGNFNAPVLSSTTIGMSNWPPQSGQVAVVGKDLGTREIIHLINFAHASSFDWRDRNGQQPAPHTFQNIQLTYTTNQVVRKIWWASPDMEGGLPQDIPFSQSGAAVSFTLPFLQYWDMVVVDDQ